MASWSSSTRPAAPIAAELARRLDGERGSAGRVPRLRSAPPRRSVAAVAAARSAGARRSGACCDPGDEVVAVPAIATEGIALFEAAVAQGIAGILARQRSSPYLPGVRSRLWRFVAAAPVAGGRGRGRRASARCRAPARRAGPRPDQPVAARRGLRPGRGGLRGPVAPSPTARLAPRIRARPPVPCSPPGSRSSGACFVTNTHPGTGSHGSGPIRPVWRPRSSVDQGPNRPFKASDRATSPASHIWQSRRLFRDR